MKYLYKAKEIIIIQHQKENFFAERRSLIQAKEVDHKCKISALHPFIDKNGILRVGGRLKNSDLEYTQKHPIIIERSWLAELLIKKAHDDTLHGGNNLVASIIRREYYIIGMKRIIKKILTRCVRCIRYKKSTAEQLMGSLPGARVRVSQPFTHTLNFDINFLMDLNTEKQI